MASSVAEDVVKQKHMVEDINVVTYRAEGMDMNSLRNLGDEVKSHLNSGVVVLSSVIDDKVSFVTMVTKDLVDRGLHAGNIIREVAKTTGGGGGGRPDMAQAGGKDSNKIDEALKLVDSLIKGQLKK